MRYDPAPRGGCPDRSDQLSRLLSAPPPVRASATRWAGFVDSARELVECGCPPGALECTSVITEFSSFRFRAGPAWAELGRTRPELARRLARRWFGWPEPADGDGVLLLPAGRR